MGTVTGNSIWRLSIPSVWPVFQELTQQQNAGYVAQDNSGPAQRFLPGNTIC
jgi:hypothetical protein